MAKLIKIIEKRRVINGNVCTHTIELSAFASSKEAAAELTEDDISADLFINGKFISDISGVLENAGVFAQMVEVVDWVELYAETVADNGCEHSDKMQEVNHA